MRALPRGGAGAGEFQRHHGDDDFTVLGIDSRDLSGDGRAFVRRFGLSYPQLRDGDGDLAHDFGTTGVPENFLIDPRGRVRLRVRGPVTSDYLDREVAPMLAGGLLVSARRGARAAAGAARAGSPAAPAAAAPPQTSLSEISARSDVPGLRHPAGAGRIATGPARESLRRAAGRTKGKSKEQIKDALVAEYGDEVLALPQGSGFDLSAYVVPIVAFVVAAIALALGVRDGAAPSGRGRRNGAAPPGRAQRPRTSERLDADLARYDL